MSDLPPEETDTVEVERSDILLLVDGLKTQSESMSEIARAVGKLAESQGKAPSRGALYLSIFIGQLVTILVVGLLALAVLESNGDVQSNQGEAAIRGKNIASILVRLDDCLDNTVDDGDPVGECAKASNDRFAAAVEIIEASINESIPCSVQDGINELIAQNPELGLTKINQNPNCG